MAGLRNKLCSILAVCLIGVSAAPAKAQDAGSNVDLGQLVDDFLTNHACDMRAEKKFLKGLLALGRVNGVGLAYAMAAKVELDDANQDCTPTSQPSPQPSAQPTPAGGGGGQEPPHPNPSTTPTPPSGDYHPPVPNPSEHPGHPGGGYHPTPNPSEHPGQPPGGGTNPTPNPSGYPGPGNH